MKGILLSHERGGGGGDHGGKWKGRNEGIQLERFFKKQKWFLSQLENVNLPFNSSCLRNRWPGVQAAAAAVAAAHRFPAAIPSATGGGARWRGRRHWWSRGRLGQWARWKIEGDSTVAE